MATDSITVRLDPRVKAGINRLVEERAFSSISAFVIDAILQKLALEGIAVDENEAASNPVRVYFRSYEGQALLRQILREELG